MGCGRAVAPSGVGDRVFALCCDVPLLFVLSHPRYCLHLAGRLSAGLGWAGLVIHPQLIIPLTPLTACHF